MPTEPNPQDYRLPNVDMSRRKPSEIDVEDCRLKPPHELPALKLMPGQADWLAHYAEELRRCYYHVTRALDHVPHTDHHHHSDQDRPRVIEANERLWSMLNTVGAELERRMRSASDAYLQLTIDRETRS